MRPPLRSTRPFLALLAATALAAAISGAGFAKGGGGGGGGGGGNAGAPGQGGTGPGNSGHGNSGRGHSDGAPGQSRGDPARDKAEKSERGKDERGGQPAAKDKAGAAASLGALNAAHASATARANAAPNSRVGQIAAYERAMQTALAIPDSAQRATAIVEVRALLDDAANKPVTPEVAARVDALLGLPATSTPPR